MPNPLQIATVVAGGMKFDTWTEVIVEGSFALHQSLARHMTLTVVEPEVHGASGIFPIAHRLDIGEDNVQGYLAGRLAITGKVVTRQVSYDAHQHGVQIIISSLCQSCEVSTVDAKPGQYINQNCEQICSAVAEKVKCGFTILGSPPGANKIFERVSEHVGETRFEFIERLCRMRNLHLFDNGKGNIQAMRSPMASVGITLAEGVNILKARMVERLDDAWDHLEIVGHNDRTFPNDPASSATVNVPIPNLNRPQKLAAEMNGDNADMGHRANQERDVSLIEQLNLEITVKDWLLPDGSLWIDHLGHTISVFSPLLFPNGGVPKSQIFIMGVRHRQDSTEGTRTDVIISNSPGDNLGVT
jgi:prophage tail gpP-like protein